MMKRVQLVLISIQVYLILIIYVVSHPKFSYIKEGENLLTAIPLFHWALLILSSAIIVLAILRSPKNRKSLTLFLGVMYGFLFYVTNLYFIIPYEQTDTHAGIVDIVEFMLASGKITHDVLSNRILSYLTYPVSFILETTMMLVVDIGKISIYTVGLFTFLGMFYIGLVLYYNKIERETKFAILSLATYIILSFYVINAQIAPQTLALTFLPYIYKLTFDFIEGRTHFKFLALILLLWFSLVFTHPFMFLFYILPILGVVLYYHFISKNIPLKGSTIGILISAWGFGFIYLFYNLLSGPIRAFIRTWGEAEGETWWVFANFLRRAGSMGPTRYIPHPHYELISKQIVDIQAIGLRLLVVMVLLIATYGFVNTVICTINNKKQPNLELIFDILVLISSGILFGLGLLTIFLGQRVFQVAFIPFSRYSLKKNNKKFIRIMLIVALILSPVAYTFNVLTNLTVGPQLFIQDKTLLIAGLWGNGYLPSHSTIIVTRETYPSEYPTQIDKIGITGILKRQNQDAINWNYLYYSKKFEHAVTYYGIEIFRDHYSYNWVYSNSGIAIIHSS